MTLLFNNKFNIIQEPLIEDPPDYYLSHITNYFENYIESEINIICPDYVSVILNKQPIKNINTIIINLLTVYLKKIKTTMQTLIKKGDFNINTGINVLITKYINKINYIHTISNLLKYPFYELFHNIIISDQIFILFIENELPILIKENNSKDLNYLLNTLKIININNTDNYSWFIKLISKIIRNDIPTITENIIMKDSYNIKILINYIIYINNYFSFLSNTDKASNIFNKLDYIINPLNDILASKINDLVKEDNNFNEFYYLVKNSLIKKHGLLKFTDVIKKSIKNNIAIKITKYCNSLTSKDTTEIYKIIELIILLTENSLVEPRLYLLLNNDIIYDNLIPFINDNIDNTIVLHIVNILNFTNSDIFIKNYHTSLIKRLLSNKINLKHESILATLLLKRFTEPSIKKILKCINDYESSTHLLSKILPTISTMKNTSISIINQSVSIKNHSVSIIKQSDYMKNTSIDMRNTSISMITTSYDAWNINFNNGYCDFINCTHPNIGLFNFIDQYNIYYNKITFNKKKLLWLLHFGEIIIEYNKYQIKLLPIQLSILELFNCKEEYDIIEIKKNIIFKNYQSDYLDNIIKSLEISGILKNTNNKLYLSEDVYNTDLINIYYNCINNNIQDTVDYELAYSRRDIICSLINHELKINDKTKDQLFDVINKNINIFTLDDALLTDALDYMLKQDYIIIEVDVYKKIYY